MIDCKYCTSKKHLNYKLCSFSMKTYFILIFLVLVLITLHVQIGFADSNQNKTNNCGINPHAPPCCIEPTNEIRCENFPVFYSTYLNGSSEVPPVETNYLGGVNLSYQSNQTVLDNDFLSFEIYLNKIIQPESIQIHKGKHGENGPVIATLYKLDKVSCCLFGSLTDKQLEGPLKNKPLSNLKELMDNKSAYINVKTKQYPEGEIRGQIFNTKGTIIDFRFFNTLSFNYTKSTYENTTSTNNMYIKYNFEKNELTFTDNFIQYNNTLSFIELENLTNFISEAKFLALPSNFTISQLPLNYSKYSLSVSINKILNSDIISSKSHIVNWIDKEPSPSVPKNLFKIAKYVEEIARPSLELKTDKNNYKENESVIIDVKNNGNNTLYFRDYNLGVKIYDSHENLVKHFTSPLDAIGELKSGQTKTLKWTIPQYPSEHYVIVVNSMNYENSPNLSANTIIKIK
jgi:CHRD domain